MGDKSTGKLVFEVKLVASENPSQPSQIELSGVATPKSIPEEKRNPWRDQCEQRGAVKLEKWTTPTAYAMALALIDRWGSVNRLADGQSSPSHSFHPMTKQLALAIHAALFGRMNDLCNAAKKADQRRLQKRQEREARLSEEAHSRAEQCRDSTGTVTAEGPQPSPPPHAQGQEPALADDAIEKSLLAICQVLEPEILGKALVEADRKEVRRTLAHLNREIATLRLLHGASYTAPATPSTAYAEEEGERGADPGNWLTGEALDRILAAEGGR